MLTQNELGVQESSSRACTHSPKAATRTTFQDELQAAVTARAGKPESDPYVFSDDDDDFFNKLLKSRKKRFDTFKAGKSKTTASDLELSDDEGKHGRRKRVSFLKTQNIICPSAETAASRPHGREPTDSFSSQHSSDIREEDKQCESNDVDSSSPQSTAHRPGESLSQQPSDDTLLDVSPCLRADDRGDSNYSVTEVEPPRPKPRQRTLRRSQPAPEKMKSEDAESEDISRPQTSSTSLPLSSSSSSNITKVSAPQSPHWAGGDCASQQFTTSTCGSDSRDGFISDDSREQETKLSTSEAPKEGDPSVSELTHVHDQSAAARWKSSRKVQSKYLGTLKVLDSKVSRELQPQEVNSLRAAVYQEWLRKKDEESREKMEVLKRAAILNEHKAKEEDAKREDAVASYEAWKEKKAEYLKAKAKEKQNVMKKEQRAMEEREEKRKSATQVFEKWKSERDHLLREKYRKQKEAERKLQQKKREEGERRRSDSRSAFSDWYEKKTDVLHNKVTTERKESKNKVEEDRYMQEEREKMAVEEYEHWLARKDREHRRRREERRIRAILRDSPPPPWSPPNKTIPFGK